MVNKSNHPVFGATKTPMGDDPKLSAVDQAYFIYYGDGRQSDVFGTKGAIAMLCLDIASQCPELKQCRIGRFGARPEELLSDAEIIRSAAEYARRDVGAVPSLQAGINLTSWRGVENQQVKKKNISA